MNHFPRRRPTARNAGCGCPSCKCSGPCACSCCCERVQVHCHCGWGNLVMPVREAPETCPDCDMPFALVLECDPHDEYDPHERNPARSLLDEKNHISHGFYAVSEKTARELARSARSSVPAREKLTHLRDKRDRSMLPSAGFELLVEHGGELYWLARTPHQGRMVWSVRKKDAGRPTLHEGTASTLEDACAQMQQARRGLPPDMTLYSFQTWFQN